MVSIVTRELNLANGGFVSTSTIGQGNSSLIDVTAEDITISSTAFPVIIPSSITSGSVSFGPSLATGNAGDISVGTDRLRIEEGGLITSLSTD